MPPLSIQQELPPWFQTLLAGQPFLRVDQKILFRDRILLTLVEDGGSERDGTPKELADVRSDQVAFRLAPEYRDRSQFLCDRGPGWTGERIEIWDRTGD